MPARKQTDRPDFIRHWTTLESADDAAYEGSDELLSIGAPLGRALGLTRIGIHHERLPPGRRTSYPHAESAEEEFVFVLEGRPDAWIDGRLYPLGEGDAVGFPAGTGLCHSILNNSDDEVRLLVAGERSKPENRIYYPCNPEQRARRALAEARGEQGRAPDLVGRELLELVGLEHEQLGTRWLAFGVGHPQ